ncbi:hypothetical protein BDZ94DRAFT_254199 [Collybia nuda]|uniref:Uncharacterized protein n=1 Tax=Collybia nuda TaxID=64659 RepID=A0A9P5XXB2_9AGAR|nr:hypothetical protein BDZ94DRAFT_254199 [Collybia nuda]
MTEYDYSPEAYERYTRTQQRIAEWVDRTEEQRPHFGSADAPRTWGVASPLLQSATKDTYANSHRSPGPMQPLRPMNVQQQSVAQQQQYQSPHKHSSHRSSHGHKPHRSAYVVTTPPATVPGYAYIYTNPQGTPGVMIVPPKGSVAASPPPTYYQPQSSAPVSGYAFPQSAPAAGSFTYAPPAQTQTQNRPQIQQIYSQASVPQVQSQTQYAQSVYPPVIYPLTPYTAYPQQTQAAVQPQPQIIFEVSSRKKHRRSESSRRSR